eukprot:296895_1
MGSQNSKKENDDEIEYLDAYELKKWILAEFTVDKKNKKSKSKYPLSSAYQVIDVRGSDFTCFGFKIKNAANHPIRNDDTIKEINKLYQSKQIIIFHCMFSQHRGPSAAGQYHAFRKQNYSDLGQQKVKILKGGFDYFWHQFNESKHKHILFQPVNN